MLRVSCRTFDHFPNRNKRVRSAFDLLFLIVLEKDQNIWTVFLCIAVIGMIILFGDYFHDKFQNIIDIHMFACSRTTSLT